MNPITTINELRNYVIQVEEYKGRLTEVQKSNLKLDVEVILQGIVNNVYRDFISVSSGYSDLNIILNYEGVYNSNQLLNFNIGALFYFKGKISSTSHIWPEHGKSYYVHIDCIEILKTLPLELQRPVIEQKKTETLKNGAEKKNDSTKNILIAVLVLIFCIFLRNCS